MANPRTKALTDHMKKKGRVTVPQAAKLALISERTVRIWIEEKKVDAVKYANQWWVSEQSVRARMTALGGR